MEKVIRYMYFSFRPTSTHREPDVTVNNSLSQDYMHPDDHIPITCNNYPKCKKKKNTKETKPISYMHYSKKKTKTINWLHTTYSVISYQKNFATKEKVCTL